MARYIDADALVEMYERSIKDDWNKKTSPTSWADAYECVIADIDDQPTADVVPKSELEAVRADAIREFADRLKKYYTTLGDTTLSSMVAYHIEQIANEMIGGGK